MSDIRKHSDDLLRDKFLSFEGDIPMSDWDIIADRLEKKRRFAWIWWAAIPLVLISGLSILTYHFTQKQSVVEGNLVRDNKIIVQEKSSIANEPSNGEKTISPQENNQVNNANKGVSGQSEAAKIKSNYPKLNDLMAEEVIEQMQPLFDIEAILINGRSVPQLWYASPEKLSLLTIEPIVHPKRKDKERIKITYEAGVNIAPAMGLDKIKENKVKSIHKEYFASIAGSSVLGSGFNNGLHFQINFGKNWYVRPGIYSSEYSVYHNYNFIDSVSPRVNANNEITDYVGKAPEKITFDGKASIKYLSIPLIFGNRISLNKHWGIESKFGFNVSRLLDASGQWVNPTFLELESINSNNSIRKWNTGMSISTGLFYKTNKNLIFTVEPNFATMLGSANPKNNPVKTRYYNYGINLNVNYILKGRNK